jgi:hypothetical protein
MRKSYSVDMTASKVNEIESQFAKLSPAAQSDLVERLVRRMRERRDPNHSEWEAGLTAMAADPEMQKELNRAHSEFSGTEADGLGRT